MSKAPVTLRDIVPEYHSRNPVVQRLFLKRLEVALELGGMDRSGPKMVLDLGCGEGAFLKYASERYSGNTYVGWDVHPAIDGLSIPGIEFARMDILGNGAIPTERFDRIFCLDVIEHFPVLDVILARIRQMLKKDGFLILSEPTENWLYRLGRLIVKGTASSEGGPAAGPHYHDAAGVQRQVIEAGFDFQAIHRIPCRPFDLFHITRYGRGR